MFFPVCADPKKDGVIGGEDYEFTGFFLGTIRDNGAWTSEPQKNGWPLAAKLASRIEHIRDIIMPLASVEVREIYFREIYKQHVEAAAKGKRFNALHRTHTVELCS